MSPFGSESAHPVLSAKAWPVRRFGSLVDEFRYGTSNKSEDSGLPALRIPNVVGGVLDLSDLKSVSVSAADEGRLRLVDGDLLFVRTNGNPAYVGRCALFSQGAVSASGLPTDRFIFASYLIRARLRPDGVLPAFVGAFMRSPAGRAQLKANSKTSAGQYNINIEGLSSIQVPLPPIDTQQAIVDVLRRADGVCRSRRRSTALLDELSRSLFLDMFGDEVAQGGRWSEARIGDLADVQGGLQVSAASRRNLPITVPYLRVANVYRNRFDLSEMKLLQVSSAEFERTRLARGDLLIVEGHGNPTEVGRVAAWTGSIDPCVHQNHLIRVRLDAKSLLSDFTCFYLNSLHGSRYLLDAARTTSGLNTINVSNVKSVPVVLPPLDVQRRFSACLEKIRKHQAINQAQSAALDDFFAGLQHEAFSGKL